MTIIEKAKRGEIDKAVLSVSQAEKMDVTTLVSLILSGQVVIPCNNKRTIKKICGIGKGLKTKVNANIGTSPSQSDIDAELRKLEIAEKYGADAIMDLSTGGDISLIRREILAKASVPVGTVPIYQVAQKYIEKNKPVERISANEIFEAIEEHAADGVDFITVHCGVTRKVLDTMISQGRVMDIVSRGGALLACWMMKNKKENPLFEDFGRLLKIAKKHDMTLSLGDGMRPGCIADATDRAQISELIVLGELAAMAKKESVQVMIEGPGHIPLNQIQENIALQKSICNQAPFYVLGPIVTDVAPGYDHITSAIGGAVAAMYGADFLCYVTPTEHLGLPGEEAVKEGVIAARIAAHAGDIAKGLSDAKVWDDKIAKSRKKRDWEQQFNLVIDPEKARLIRQKSSPKEDDICSMCGGYCSMKMMDELLKK